MAKSKKNVKKEFFEVSAPFSATKVYLYAANLEELNGKNVRLDLTRNLRGKNLDLVFKVNLVDGKLVGEPTALEIAGSYIRRMMRKGADYVEDSFFVECKDSKVQVKPFLIARSKVSRAIRDELRKNAKMGIEAFCKARSSKEMFSDILSGKIQRELSLKLKKIYPLALCEIRIFRIVSAPVELKA